MPNLGGWRPDSTMPSHLVRPASSLRDGLSNLRKARNTLDKVAVQVNGVIDLRRWCSPVEEQLESSSCVGNATVGALELLQIRNGQPLVDLSRLFVYYNARLYHGDQEKDAGSFINLAFRTLTTLGTCPESVWPFDLDKLFIRPSWTSYREAYPNKTSDYYAISSSGEALVDDIKLALLANHPVVFGMTVDQAYIESDGIISMPGSVRRNPGGHAQVIVGMDEGARRYIVRNSWGSGWGIDGYAMVPFDYLEVSDANDFWVPFIDDNMTTVTRILRCADTLC